MYNTSEQRIKQIRAQIQADEQADLIPEESLAASHAVCHPFCLVLASVSASISTTTHPSRLSVLYRYLLCFICFTLCHLNPSQPPHWPQYQQNFGFRILEACAGPDSHFSRSMASCVLSRQEESAGGLSGGRTTPRFRQSGFSR
jgi:hypothetical protein